MKLGSLDWIRQRRIVRAERRNRHYEASYHATMAAICVILRANAAHNYWDCSTDIAALSPSVPRAFH